jgi:hypothetical protein
MEKIFIEGDDNTTKLECIKDAITKIKNFYLENSKVIYNVWVFFKKPTNINVNRYNIKQTIKYKLRFFESMSGNYCYTTSTKFGWEISDEMIENIEYIGPIDISKKELVFINKIPSSKEKENLIKSILKSRHKNVWKNLTEEELRKCSELTKTQLPKIIKHLQKDLQEAMDNKKSFSHVEYGFHNRYYISCNYQNSDYVCHLIINGKNNVQYIIVNPKTIIKKY